MVDNIAACVNQGRKEKKAQFSTATSYVKPTEKKSPKRTKKPVPPKKTPANQKTQNQNKKTINPQRRAWGLKEPCRERYYNLSAIF